MPILKETPRNDGITEIELDLNGLKTVTISVPTQNRHLLSDDDLEQIAAAQRGKMLPKRGEL